MKIVFVGGAVLILLTVAKAVAPTLLFFLPLGGSVIAEMGIVLGTAAAFATLTHLR